MLAPVSLWDDFDSALLRLLARRTRDANQSRRLLVLAEIYDGGSRGDAARIGGVDLQTVRDWVLRFNAAGPDRLVDGKAPGRLPTLDHAQRQALARIVESGANPGGAWGRSLATARSGPMALGGVPGVDLAADLKSGTARDGLPQAVGPAAPSCAERARHRGV